MQAFFLSHLSFFLSLAVAALLAVATLALYRPIGGLVYKLLRRLTSRRKSELPGVLLDACEPPCRLFLLCSGLYCAAAALAFSSERFNAAWHAGALGIYRLAVIALVTWAAARLCTPDTAALLLPGRSADAMGRTFCIFFARILRLVVGAFGVVIVISELGFDVGGLIAGIGLGGLTIALAAQDWASNLFGGMVILFDKPFAVDDWISVEDTIEGIVEDMTFRTTRIRTFDHSQIVVPNALLVSKPVVNWSRMEKRKISFDIGLTYGTPAEKLQACAARIDAMLRADAEIHQELISVTFSEFADSSLNVRVHCFATLTGYAEYMKVKERVNYGIAAIVEELGLSFAFPTRTIVLEGPPKQS